MPIYKIKVVYPVHMVVDATDMEKAKDKALKRADYWLKNSSIKKSMNLSLTIADIIEVKTP